MALVDSIIGVESGGNPTKVLCSPYVFSKSWVVSIGELFFVGCPTAVSRYVADLRVSAVNGVLGGRLWSHVRKKVFKAVQPTLADFDAPRSIIFVADVRRARASLLHRTPSPILGGFLQAVGFHFGAHCLSLEASAALCFRGSKAVLANNRSVPAVACAAIASYAACPSLMRMPLRIDFEINNKSSNSLARKVNYHGD